MTYDEFVCECVMRLGAANEKLPPRSCVDRAERLAESLVKAGFIRPPLRLVKKKFDAYVDALQSAHEARKSEQKTACANLHFFPEEYKDVNERLRHADPEVRKAALEEMERLEKEADFSREVLERIERFIEAKNEYLGSANLLMQELSQEAKKSGERVSLSSVNEALFASIEQMKKDVADKEQELLDDLELHKDNWDTLRIRQQLIESMEAEKQFKNQGEPAVEAPPLEKTGQAKGKPGRKKSATT